MKKSSKIIIFLAVVITALSIFKAVAYNRLSTSGLFVGKIEEKIEFYKTQNTILSEKLLRDSSLSNISIKAKELGFVKDNSNSAMTFTSRSLAVKQ